MPKWKLNLIRNLGGVPMYQFNDLLAHYLRLKFETGRLQRELSALRARTQAVPIPPKPFKVH